MSSSPRMSHSDEEETAQTRLIESPHHGQPSLWPSTWRALCVAAAVLALIGCAVGGAAVRGGTSESRGFLRTNLQGYITAASTVTIKSDGDQQSVQYPVIFRDFEGNDVGKGITMFEETCTSSSKIVKPTLGDDKKPVWSGVKGEGGITTEKQFNVLWNTDPEINKEIIGSLELMKSPDGDFRHDSTQFFPLDGDGERNYYFTMELHAGFTYKGGEQFSFRGDDDVYLFIDKRLVVNLGGCHGPHTAIVDVDELGLTKGGHYDFDFFFAERKCCGSSLRLETTLQFDDPVPIDDPYKCCVTHLVNKDWSFVCFESKKFWFCEDEPPVATSG